MKLLNNQRWIDISMPIHPNMMVYKNKEEKKPIFQAINTLDQRGSYETLLTLNLHTGTHIDFPLHMQAGGQTSTGFSIKELITSVIVYDLSHLPEKIEEKDLRSLTIQRDDFLLFKTKNSAISTFDFSFVYVSESAARYLADLGIRGVGIDALGIERDQKDHQTHHILMNAGVIILEGLRLANVTAGAYTMMALPLSIEGVEALPVRALLTKDE
jgi:arylformamidase